MTARSLLFVPGDSDRKLAKAVSSRADMLILDLEDSVASSEKAAARGRVREFLASHPLRAATQLWVRVYPLGGADVLADLVAVVAARPDGIVLPKSRSPDDVIRLAHYLDVQEAQHGLEAGAVRILPIATETPEALFSLGGFARCGPRLYGLTWGAEDLATALGATGNQLLGGDWTAPYQLARSLCLFGAGAAGVAAIDTLFPDIRDLQRLRSACADARRDGFAGKMAIHPDQVDVINECFAPSAQELAHAARVVALFRAHPGAGVLALDGQMLDRPHLAQAERTLARAAAVKS